MTFSKRKFIDELHEYLQSGETYRALISNYFKVSTNDSNTKDMNCEIGLENVDA